ncbi:MAG: hypothetical protein K6F87_00410 [Lachnospiraceae bacterium]|nr:hypothetical protein [Lachnospiraceae bacterium]
MNKKIMTLIMTALIAAAFCMPVMASEMEKDSAGNVFSSGETATLPDSGFHTGFAVGSNVDLSDSEADGSIFAAGQQVTASGASADESMFVAGNTLTLNNIDVDGNVFAAGNMVNIVGNSSANGVYAAGSSVVFEGEAKGLYLAGASVSVKGYIDGDVTIDADTVQIDDGTEITGDLTVRAPSEPTLPDDVEVGNYYYEKAEDNSGDGAVALSIGARILKKITKTLYWAVAMAAFGMLLCWLFNDHLRRAGDYITNRTAPMVVSGIIGWLCTPVAILLLLISYILAPIGGFLLLVYVLLLCAGLAFAGASIARLVFPNMNVFLSALIGIVVLEVVGMIPVIGSLVAIAADMYLIGYVIQVLWLNRLRRKPEIEQL